ncbi:type II secretion system minor pseudopilin GspK [Marinimicrobium alkaliphilum]|uniref:type II secretion system minor pseudopilin GspK n=1 Tax=Marinimicrobium alkaliphilum TaxID=2202654 RepID=UPI0013004037|nr:type II secretion system minor pseudopilin GspK [Marinimicrobium alkaliphilum]
MSVDACLNLHKLANARRERGAALIMAVLIVAVVAALSIRYMADYSLGLARAEGRWHGAQARVYLQGAETLARTMLRDVDPEVDGLHEPWAQPLPPFEVEGGWIMATIEDAQSRFNLNNLGGALDQDRPYNDPQRFSVDQRRFIRLLQSFEDVPIAEDEAIAMLEAVVDWMDPDDDVSGFGGAESAYYQSLDPPYLAANAPFTSVDELRLVRYFEPEIMALLRPYLIVMPAGQGMNINTLPERLMRTLNSADILQPLTDMQVSLLREEWPFEGFYENPQAFAENFAWSSIIAGSAPDLNGLAVNTGYFLVQIQVELVEQRRSMESLLRRDADRLIVVRRTDVY